MKSFKLLFFASLIMGLLITISSNSWMSMWIGLEVNLLSIIPLLSTNKQNNSAEATIKYFITQVMASSILLLSIILMININDQNFSHQSNLMMITQSALFIKMGAAPFHAWFPEVMEGLTWMNCMIMLTVQKIAPMIVLLNIITPSYMIFLVIIISLVVGGLFGINQVSLRKIMAYSSINHIGWMITAMMSLKSLWIIYFFIYSGITTNIIIILNSGNLSKISQIPLIFKTSKINSLFFSMNFLSLGGLPPFLGFLPKWLTIQQLIFSSQWVLTAMMVILTLITLYFYLRMSFSSMMMSMDSSLSKNFTKIKPMIFIINLWSLLGLAGCSLLPNPL
uniref:NADH-ubiquinone oxidoreductase chain 2 n=1 Tax=Stylosomus rugithorax TaxID=1425630 RepID=A0A3G1GQ40_9CUCU|nr:NADH dehydrogenase subunit 2 [Stylosomus rugithorax]